MANPTRELTPPANYGRMAFDVFLMEQWNYSADETQDKAQWDSLAREYLSMKPRERYPYHMESSRRIASNYEAAAENNIVISRILPSFQTVQERNFCSRKMTHTSHDPALVRTYYGDPNGQLQDGQLQDEAHKAMIRDAILEGLIEEEGAWDNKALYDFGDDWQRVLLRAPDLCDQERHASEELYRESQSDAEAPSPSDREALDPWLASRNIVTRLYVTDREAMESGKIKVFYLDVHGRAVWHHKFSADLLLEYDGAWHSMNLAEINGAFSETQENGCELYI